MKRPTILAGIAFAFVVAVFAFPVWWGLRVTLPDAIAFRVVTLGGYLAYCVYLLRTAKTRVGALSLGVANLVVGLGLAFLPITTTAVGGASGLNLLARPTNARSSSPVLASQRRSGRP